MRIISQNGRNDVLYDITHLHIIKKDSVDLSEEYERENDWLILAECISIPSTTLLASYDTEEEAKERLLDVAHGWKRNYQVFYMGEKE